VTDYTFYIQHDEATGRDMRFASEPNIRFLTVKLIGDVEQTYTSSVKTMVGPWHAIIQPRPKGVGWTLHQDRDSDSHTVWRRPHDAKAHADPANWPRGGARLSLPKRPAGLAH